MGKRRRSKHQEAGRSRQNPAWVDITKENALLETYYQVCGAKVTCIFIVLLFFRSQLIQLKMALFGNKTSPKV